ncbi:MAG: glycoside hydrolase family 43 protein [Eubacteriales bacterium]
MKNISFLFVFFLLLICGFILSSCENGGKIAESSETKAEPAAENILGEAAMTESYFTYADANYSFDGTKITAAKTAAVNADQIYSGAFYEDERVDADFAAEVDMTLDSLYAAGGLLFRASAADSFDGFTGYALMIRDRKIYLYEAGGSKVSGMVLTELGRASIEDYRRGDTLRLRVERQNNTYRLYYLDDADGVQPWPEFEFVLNDCRGTGIGFIDNGQGVSFDNLTLLDYEAPEKGDRLYKNPVFSEAQAADPGVLYHDGTYYCYSTSAPIGYYVYTSTDLVNWKNEGLCCEMAWGIDKSGYYWAPEVVEHNGRFYMIMSVDEHLGFAVADSPLGPFLPEKNWLFDKTIDGHIFLDDDGRAYLFYVTWRDGHEYGIYGCELEDDIVTVKPNTEVHLLSPKEAWEKTDGSVTEGPFVLKHNGTYYLTYSGTGYTSPDYAVGYATSDSPLGEYTRYTGNPILSRTEKLYGPGHHCFTTSPDGSELFIVYHVHASTTEVHPRKICVDRARFAPTASGTDRLEIYGPTHTAQEYPK